MKPLFSIVVTICVVLAVGASETQKPKELAKEPVVEAEESEPQERKERCTACSQGVKLNLESPKDILAALQQLPAGEVHTQQSFEGCSSENGCAGIKVKDGQVIQKFGNLDAFKQAVAQDTSNEFTFHAAGSNVFDANGPFWWMNKNSPFKTNGGAYEKFSKSSSSFSSTGSGGIDLASNPFLNGGFSKLGGGFTSAGGAGGGADNSGFQSSSSFESSYASKGGNIDISKNPFLNGKIGANQFSGQTGFGSQSGFGQSFESGQGYTGSSPSPFSASTAGSNINLIQNSQKGFGYEQNVDEAFQNTGNVLGTDQGDLTQTCAGQGYVCVPRAQCNNGVVNTNGANILQANTQKQYCNLRSEICCRIEVSSLSGTSGLQGSLGVDSATYSGSSQGSGLFATGASQGNFGASQSSFGSGFESSRGSSFGATNSFGSGASANRGSGFGSSVGTTLAPTSPAFGTSQSNFIETDAFAAGSGNVYRPGATGLKPGIPYLPPVDSSNSPSNIVPSSVYPTSFVTTPRPFTTPRPITPRPFTTAKPTYLPPVPSTSAPGYLPPVAESSIPRETVVVPPYSEGGLILDQTIQPSPRPPPPRPFVPLPAPSDIPAGCAAALKCTPIEFCTAEGIISNTSVVLTRDQESYRVPLTDCKDIESGRIGKCCRDPYYTDPWPTNQLGRWVPGVFGGNDGKYVPDSRGSSSTGPIVTARPPTTGEVIYPNYRTTQKPTGPAFVPNRVTSGFPSTTVSPGPFIGQGQYGLQGVGQVGIGGGGQIGIGGRGQTSFQGVGQSSTPGYGSLGIGQGTSEGVGFARGQGSGAVLNQGGGQVQTGGLGFGVTQGQAFGVTQGQGVGVTQGQGLGVTQGQGVGISQGVGSVYDQGFGQSEAQGVQTLQGVGVERGSGVGVSQGAGIGVSQGSGLSGNQGVFGLNQGGLGVRQGGGFGGRQGSSLGVTQSGLGVRRNNGLGGGQVGGFGASQGAGFGTRQGVGAGVNQGAGLGVGRRTGIGASQGAGFGAGGRQGSGLGVSQGAGLGVNQGAGLGVSQGSGLGVSQGGGLGVRQGGGFGAQRTGLGVGQDSSLAASQAGAFGGSQRGLGQGSFAGQGAGIGAQAGGFGAQGTGIGGRGSGFGGQGGGIGAQGAGFGAQGAGIGGQRAGFGAQRGGIGSQGAGFGAQGASIGVQGAGLGAQGAGFGAQGAGIGTQGAGFGAQGAGIGAQGAGFGAQGTGIGGQGTGFGAQGGGSQGAGFRAQGGFGAQAGQGGFGAQGAGIGGQSAGFGAQGGSIGAQRGVVGQAGFGGQGLGGGQSGALGGQGFNQGGGFGAGQGGIGARQGGFGADQGFGVVQGFGTGVKYGTGQQLVSGRGQAIIQSEGQGVIGGGGYGIKNGGGFTVTQGGGYGVENEYSESTHRVFLQRYSGGGQCGLLNPQKPYGNRNELEVDFAEIPWQAMVLLQTNKSLLCGGVITRPEVVLTSASCVDGLDAKNVLIKGGEWKLGIDDEPLPFQIVQVKTIIRHPEYRRGSLKYDVAILVLNENLRFAKNIQPICLPSSTDTLDAFYNGAGECVVTGWGKTVLQAHLSGSIMHALNVSLINPGECQAKLSSDYPHLLEQYDQDSCVCGQPTNPLNNICKVDIGSALACTTGDSHFVLRGVYSWDSGCQIGNQIAGFYKFDLEWYEWAIGLIESVRFAKYTKITTGKVTQVSSTKTTQYSGVKTSGAKEVTSGSGANFGQFSVTGGTKQFGQSQGVGQIGQIGVGKFSEGSLSYGTEIKSPVTKTVTTTYTSNTNQFAGGKGTGGSGQAGAIGQGVGNSFGQFTVTGGTKQFGQSQGAGQISGQIGSGKFSEGSLSYGTEIKSPVTNTFTTTYTSNTNQFAGGKGTGSAQAGAGGEGVANGFGQFSQISGGGSKQFGQFSTGGFTTGLKETVNRVIGGEGVAKGFGQFSQIAGGSGQSQVGLNFGTDIKPITNTFSATYSEKKVFQSEPKIVTYTTKPEIVTYTTKPEIVTFTTKPEYFTYTTKPEIVTFTTKPEYFTFTTKPKLVSYTTKPQYITYQTSDTITSPQVVAPEASFNPSFSELVGKHKHNAQCKCLEGKK